MQLPRWRRKSSLAAMRPPPPRVPPDSPRAAFVEPRIGGGKEPHPLQVGQVAQLVEKLEHGRDLRRGTRSSMPSTTPLTRRAAKVKTRLMGRVSGGGGQGWPRRGPRHGGRRAVGSAAPTARGCGSESRTRHPQPARAADHDAGRLAAFQNLGQQLRGGHLVRPLARAARIGQRDAGEVQQVGGVEQPLPPANGPAARRR